MTTFSKTFNMITVRSKPESKTALETYILPVLAGFGAQYLLNEGLKMAQYALTLDLSGTEEIYVL